MAQVPLVRYLANEAASGTGPTALVDSSAGTPLNLTITYGTGGGWNSAAAGRYITFATSVSNLGAISGFLTGTKVATALAGSKTATWEVVATTSSVNAYAVIAQFGAVGNRAQFDIAQSGTSGGNSLLDLYFNDVKVGSFTVTTGKHVFHLVADTTQATAANRVILYVDGAAVTMTGTTFPVQNTAIDAAESNYSVLLVCLGCFGSVASLQFAGSVHYAALYATAFASAEAAANATALAANDDADPNGGAPPATADALFFGMGV